MITHKILASIIAATGIFTVAGAAMAQQTPGTMNNGSMSPAQPSQNQNVPVTKPGRFQDAPALIRGNQTPGDQTTQTNSSQSEQYKNLSDRDFVMKAAQSNMAEIKLSELALQKTSSDSVRQYAQEMIRDHNSAGQELMQIAGNKGITLPMDIDATHKATYNRIQALNGADFDQAYLNAMVQDHSNAVFLFQAQAQQGQDADLRAFASKKLPTFQSHLAMSQNLTAVASNSVGQSDANLSTSNSTSTTSSSTSTTQGSQTDNTSISQSSQTDATTTDSQSENNTSEPISARW